MKGLPYSVNCISLLAIQMIVCLHTFIKYKSLGLLSQGAIAPQANFFLTVALNAGMCRSNYFAIIYIFVVGGLSFECPVFNLSKSKL